MKITEQRLKKIIKEELAAHVQEAGWGGAAAWLDEPEEEETQKRHLPFLDDPEEPRRDPTPEELRADVDRPPHLSRQQWAALKKKLKSSGQTSWHPEKAQKEYLPWDTEDEEEDLSPADLVPRLVGIEPVKKKKQ
jgi:hypothetical protein